MSGPILNALTPAIGARIKGLDITRLDEPRFEWLYQAWLRHKLLFIHDQTIELDDLLAFSRRFGKLMRLPYIKPHDGYPDVIRVLKQADEVGMGTFGGEWHSDFSFLAAPPQASILYAEDIPPLGGDTLWADMALAWRRLPPDLRAAVDGRIAIHSGTPYGVAHAPAENTRFKGSIEIERNNPEADRETRHPAVCRHPQTDEPMLFVNPTYTTGIDGYEPAEARALLDIIYRHCTRPEFCCRFKWEPGIIALWDNRNTMHYAVNDYDGYRRCLYRTTIEGDPPCPSD